jgi:hypothetical protein
MKKPDGPKKTAYLNQNHHHHRINSFQSMPQLAASAP